MAECSSFDSEDSDFSDEDQRVESLQTLIKIMKVREIPRRSKIPIIDTTVDSTPQESYPALEVLSTPTQGESEFSTTNGVKASASSVNAADVAVLTQLGFEKDDLVSLGTHSSPTLGITPGKNSDDSSTGMSALALVQANNNALIKLDHDNNEEEALDSRPDGYLVLRADTFFDNNNDMNVDTLHFPGNSSPNVVEENNSVNPCVTFVGAAEDVTINEVDSDNDATEVTVTVSFPAGGTKGTSPNSLEPTDSTPKPNSHGNIHQNRGRLSRNPVPDPKIWAREETKLKRMKGEDYVGFRRKDKSSSKIMIQDTPKGARTMGPICPPGSKCGKWANRKCHQLDESKRNALFESFWHNMNWGQKRMYVGSLVIANDPARKTKSEPETTPKKPRKPKDVSYSYYLIIDSHKSQVCRTTFLNTFGLKNSMVRYWLGEYAKIGQTSSGLQDSTENNMKNINEATSSLPVGENPQGAEDAHHGHDNVSNQNTSKTMLMEFLSAMPKLPSHYCRKSSTRLYLQTDITSIGKLYNLYKDYCVQQQSQPLSRYTFDKQCKEMKLSVFRPKKDQCDICTDYKHKNVAQEKYDLHILLKNQAREEKKADKILAEEGKAHVLCCDVMAVKLLPAIETSVAYYKMKYAIHNYTVYNLGNHDANCFWFVESECKLVSSVFATCLVEEIDRLLTQQNRNVIIYSDGCGYQNRNAALSNALLSVSMRKNVTIFQKFLERGHTQMECDSVHSVIENACKKKDGIYLPHEMVQITKESRKLPFPYRAKLMYHTDFKDYSVPEKVRYSSIRPGTKSNDPVVTDIRCLKYSPSGTISYKLRYDEDFQDVPRRPKNVTSALEGFPPLFLAPIPIPKDKWEDLQSLKTFIPKDCHDFYNNIPHQEESYRKGVAHLRGKKRPLSPVAGPSGIKKNKKDNTKKD